jgi:hypothetical protein
VMVLSGQPPYSSMHVFAPRGNALRFCVVRLSMQVPGWQAQEVEKAALWLVADALG